jgi:hypothetical protein
MKKFALVVVLMLSMIGMLGSPVMAASPEQSLCEGSGGTWNGNACANGTRTVPDTIKAVNNILVFIVGAVSVVMIIIGGFRYALSAGDSSAASGAKNTIIYAVVGLVVAVSAWAIVNFVLGNL